MPVIPIDYERIIQEVYEALLRPGDIAVDIGAHTGRHTAPLAKYVTPRGRVHAVEPINQCRDTLKELCSHFEHVTIHGCALSDRAGVSDFVIAEKCPAFSGLKQVPYPEETPLHTSRVKVQTFDALFARLPRLRFIKLDAEGAELAILRGARDCIEKFRPVIAFEFGTWSNQVYDTSPGDIMRFWSERNYDVFAITGEKLNDAQFKRSAVRREIWDYVAVPCEDGPAQTIVAEALCRARINILAIRSELNHAAHHADVGATVPPLKSFRGPLQPLARLAARTLLKVAEIITVPQRICNRAILHSMEILVSDLERVDAEYHRRAAQLRQLEERINELEMRLTQSVRDNQELAEELAHKVNSIEPDHSATWVAQLQNDGQQND